MDMHNPQQETGIGHATTTGLTVPPPPPHPNTSITAEILAPLMSEHMIEALKEIRGMICKRAPGPIMFSAVDGRIDRGSDREARDAERLARLELISALEEVIDKVARPQQSPAEIIQNWKELVFPLIERVFDFSKSGENNITSAIKRFQGSVINLKSIMAPEPDSTETEGAEKSGEGPNLSEMLERFASLATDSTRQLGKHNRTILNSLRYEPFSQYDQVHLNELAIGMKQRGFEINMDKRDPVASVGEDDIRLLAELVGSRMKDWAREASEALFTDLIDPVTALTMPDQEALADYCEAISQARTISLDIDGTEMLKFSLTLPLALPLTQQQASQRINELLEPLTNFERALGFSHEVNIERTHGAIKVTLNLALPFSSTSHYEPDNFHLRELALSRLDSKTSLEHFKEIAGMSEEADEMLSVEIDPPQTATSYSLTAPGNLTVTLTRSLIEEKPCEETLDFLRLAAQIAKAQPDIERCYLNLPKERLPAMAQAVVGEKIMIRMDNASVSVPSDLDAMREALEEQRSSVRAVNPMHEAMQMMQTSRNSYIQGVLAATEIPTAMQRATQLPEWISCSQMRLKLFTLEEQPFNALMNELEHIKGVHHAERIYLVELPPSVSNPGTKTTLKFLTFSEAEVPLAEVTLDSASSEISVKHFESALFMELRDRIASTLNRQEILTPSRSRDIDAMLLAAGLDLTAPLIEQLTKISNSWAGREIPSVRITQVLGDFYFDEMFAIRREGEAIRYLHHSEQPAVTLN